MIERSASDRLRPWVAVVLGAGALLLYAQLAGHSFLHYDDNVYVTQNAIVRRGLTWSGVVWAFTSADAWYGFPLDWISHMVDVQLFGLDARAHLLVNAGLHAANTVLVYVVLARLTRRPWRSAVTAALWAAHPLRVESVAWLSERKGLLAALFGLVAIAAYAWYAERASVRRYAVVVAAFAASLLSKPVLVTLPLLLLLVDVWPLARPVRLRRLVVEKLPLVALATTAALVSALAQRHGGALRGDDLPLSARLAYAPVSCAVYVAKLVWPTGLSPYYRHPGTHLPAWQAILAAVGVAAATTLAVRDLRRRSPVSVGWLWFVVALAPVIGIVKAGAHGIADRYTYVPTIGLVVAVVWSFADLVRTPGFRRLAVAAAIVSIAPLAIASWHQESFWKDHVALFMRAVDVDPQSAMAHHVLSQGLEVAGRGVEALAHAREAVRLEPSHARMRKNLGYVLYRAGLLDEAIAEFEAAIALDAGYAEAHENLAIAYVKKGRRDIAAREFQIARELAGRVR